MIWLLLAIFGVVYLSIGVMFMLVLARATIRTQKNWKICASLRRDWACLRS